MQNLFSCPIIVDEWSASEIKYNLLASKEQLLELIEIFKVPNITKFQAVIFVKYNIKNHNLEVGGNLYASIVS